MFGSAPVESTNTRKGEPAFPGEETPKARWQFGRGERRGLVLAAVVILAFGALLEKRTALRRVPMTDLGVFACAASAVKTGADFYAITDWHGWHYHYPPFLAILFRPLAHPIPEPPAVPEKAGRTADNTPWGYDTRSGPNYYGLHAENLRFFWIVAVWYVLSVCMGLLAAHLLACTLDGTSWLAPLPLDPDARRKWWWLRLAPVLLCLVSVGTDLSRGQVDLLMLFALSAALYLAERRRDGMAGLLAALPAAIKLFPPFYLLLPLWWRRWRMAWGVLLGLTLALVLVPVAALGPSRTAEAYRTWAEVLARPSLGTGHDTSRAEELTNINGTDNQSLLAFIHNWKFQELPRRHRPPQVSPGTRSTVYWIGALMLVGCTLAFGWRRRESPRERLLMVGVLVGMAFVVSPVVHNYYYLLIMPLLAGIVAHGLDSQNPAKRRRLVAALICFMTIDILARLPGAEPFLRDVGAPLLSLVLLLVIGAVLLWQRPKPLAKFSAC